jgi:hypothetical protein
MQKRSKTRYTITKMVHWFEIEENERIKQTYSQYTIQDFWDWWSDGQNVYMEVRVKDYSLTKEIASKFNLLYSISGVYINTGHQLKNVIMYARNKTTIWFGVNPRKRNVGRFGNIGFGGKDTNIQSINFLFIDIDRKIKETKATNDELKQCDVLAEEIISRLTKENWSKNYIKLCTGNGIQLLIKLDVFITIPIVNFGNIKQRSRKGEEYVVYYPLENEEFTKIKQLIKDGIGKDILKFSKNISHKLKLDVEVDKAVFNIGRVAALPFTKNFKYGSFTWRGILDLQKGENSGLTDYILSYYGKIKTFDTRGVLIKYKSSLLNEDILKKGHLREHLLIKFMLENDFPEGGINNTLWLMIKCLLRDNKIDIASDEFKHIHEELKTKHKRTFTLNLPDIGIQFNRQVVNNYCISHLIVPLYQVYPNKIKPLNFDIQLLQWEEKDVGTDIIELEEDTTIEEDMTYVKQMLQPNNRWHNINILGKFLRGCTKKYSEEKTKYYYKYLFERFLDWQ